MTLRDPFYLKLRELLPLNQPDNSYFENLVLCSELDSGHDGYVARFSTGQERVVIKVFVDRKAALAELEALIKLGCFKAQRRGSDDDCLCVACWAKFGQPRPFHSPEFTDSTFVSIGYEPWDGDLLQLLNNHPDAPISWRLDLWKRVAKLVQQAHNTVFHLDLKLENILYKGTFPIVRLALIDYCFSMPSTGSLLCESRGSPHLLAPEIFGLQRPIVPLKADTWGLGVMLVAMIWHAYPWKECSSDDLDFSTYKAKGSLTFEAITQELDALVHRCLAVDPQARPSVAQLVNDPLFNLNYADHHPPLHPQQQPSVGPTSQPLPPPIGSDHFAVLHPPKDPTNATNPMAVASLIGVHSIPQTPPHGSASAVFVDGPNEECPGEGDEGEASLLSRLSFHHPNASL